MREATRMDIETAAQLMGMKPHREVREVVPVDGGHAVHTHDDQWTLITDDNEVAGAIPAPEQGEQASYPDEAAPDEVLDDLTLIERVPDGNKDDVLAWVGTDPARARAALDVELGREPSRSTLIAALEKVAS
jgi:hypothetical protein